MQNILLNLQKKQQKTNGALSEITEDLFLSGVGGITSENLQTASITHVVNMATELRDFVYPLPDLHIHRLNLRDSLDEDIFSVLEDCVRLVDDIQKNGGRILVHCVAGISRSATVCIAYLIKTKQMSLKDAHQHVFQCREIIFPNKGFWRALIKYEESVRGVNSVEMRPYISGMDPDVYFYSWIRPRILNGWRDELYAFWSVNTALLICQILGLLMFDNIPV
ncbi:dual specificity protein phosphatase 18-like [Saccostrea echinata]|uniref:dual specificity protein phosphatase 18-like n=1 Tax=Saccostrea echinata TaxID=191078 RepID=UPI002A82F63F|nr:dual specificity protein phosphatase 18-like [Saccostrea echinata]